MKIMLKVNKDDGDRIEIWNGNVFCAIVHIDDFFYHDNKEEDILDILKKENSVEVELSANSDI